MTMTEDKLSAAEYKILGNKLFSGKELIVQNYDFEFLILIF